MSCQQVPRLIEDPYTFTETPVGTTYFTSPIQKHATIRSANQLPSQLKSISNRLNGAANGVTSLARHAHVPVYAKQPIYQQRCQQENSTKPPIVRRDFAATAALSPLKHSASKSASACDAPAAKTIASIQKSVGGPDKSPVSSNHSITVKLAPPPAAPRPSQQQTNGTNGVQASPTHAPTNGDSGSGTNGSLNGAPPPARGPTNGKGKGKGKGKGSAENDTFVRPKIDGRHTIGKRISLSGKAQTNGKRKRGYSQTAHHEVLQRIPQRSHDKSHAAAQPKQANEAPKVKREWHAPDSLLYEYVCATDANSDELDVAPSTQSFWFDMPEENLLTREQRLETKRDNLRRQAFQYLQAQNFRNKSLAKMRIVSVAKALGKFRIERYKNPQQSIKCSVSSCANNALALTAYCYLHITLNADQKLFHPCTAKFSDNSQCRVPVFDISHELPLCPEHAWKRDNYNRMAQEHKPKKTMRKKAIKPAPPVRTPKRYKKKKKSAEGVDCVTPIQTLAELEPTLMRASPKLFSSSMMNVSWNQKMKPEPIDAMPKSVVNIPPSLSDYFLDNPSKYHFSPVAPGLTSLSQQEMFTVCENSSAYESSEDTGVGGLSESELMGASDGIEIPLGDARLLEEHDITNVLEQLPEDAFNDLFEGQQNDHYEPTQKEQDELARALEEADQQVKSLKQMTGSDFLDSFLDVGDEIFVDSGDICADVLSAGPIKNDIRGLVHT